MKILDIEKLRRIKPADFHLTCSVEHRHEPEHVVVCAWKAPDVARIEVHFARKTVELYVADLLSGVYENLTIDEFMRLQYACQMMYNAVLERFVAEREQNGTM